MQRKHTKSVIYSIKKNETEYPLRRCATFQRAGKCADPPPLLTTSRSGRFFFPPPVSNMLMQVKNKCSSMQAAPVFHKTDRDFVNLYCHLTVRLGFSAFPGSVSFYVVCMRFLWWWLTMKQPQYDALMMKSANMQNDGGFNKSWLRTRQQQAENLTTEQWTDTTFAQWTTNCFEWSLKNTKLNRLLFTYCLLPC